MTPIPPPAAALWFLFSMLQPALATGVAPASPFASPAAVDSDADRDGVADAIDACPGTPRGYPVGDNGCAIDSDGDGVADGADGCPATRPVVHGIDEPVDPQGCSTRD